MRSAPEAFAGHVPLVAESLGFILESESNRGVKLITDDLVDALAARAEDGVDVDEMIRRRGGRPPMGSAASSVESVRLDPELSEALHDRADREGRTSSDIIREALRRCLEAS